jgi:hypothetical protein
MLHRHQRFQTNTILNIQHQTDSLIRRKVAFAVGFVQFECLDGGIFVVEDVVVEYLHETCFYFIEFDLFLGDYYEHHEVGVVEDESGSFFYLFLWNL